MIHFPRLLLAAMLLSACPSLAAAQAQPLWFQFTGTTPGLPGDLEYLGDKHFILTIRLDPTKLDGNLVDPISGIYYDSVTAGRLEIVVGEGSSLFWTILPSSHPSSVSVVNRLGGVCCPDIYQAGADMIGPLQGEQHGFSLELTDNQGTALVTDAFPTDLPNFADFEKRQLFFPLLGGNVHALVETFAIVPGLNMTDGDADGVPDESDNCPSTPNGDQSDRDADGIGDLCDPFPDARDNEKAQCFVDLGVCSANLTASQSQLSACSGSLSTAQNSLNACSISLTATQAALTAATTDADGDGLPDSFDRCAGTPVGVAIDAAGCSVAQFCGTAIITTKATEAICTKLDWLNDEPAMTSKQADCRVDRLQKLCLAR